MREISFADILSDPVAVRRLVVRTPLVRRGLASRPATCVSDTELFRVERVARPPSETMWPCASHRINPAIVAVLVGACP